MNGLLPPEIRRALDERFRAAVHKPNDRVALQPLREDAGLLRQYLMTDEGRATLTELEPDADLDWLHEIYGALSEFTEETSGKSDDDGSPGLAEALDRFRGLQEASAPSHLVAAVRRQALEDPVVGLHPSDREDALVGRAFEQLLVEGLPQTLVDVERFFAETERVDSRIERALRATPSVTSAGPVANRLARYGITPILVVNASQAVATAARRHYRAHRLLRDREVVIDYRCLSNDPESITVLHRAPLCAGVQLATELGPDVSDRLFDWLMYVANCKPLLLDGFRARGVEMGLLLEPVAERVDLFTAWATATPHHRSEPPASR